MQPVELQHLAYFLRAQQMINNSLIEKCVRCGIGVYNTFGNCTNCPAKQTDDQTDEVFYADEQDEKDEQNVQEYIDLDQTLTD